MTDCYEELKFLGKKGCRQLLKILPIDFEPIIIEDNSLIKNINPISLKSFASLNNYNSFYRDVKETLLKYNLIETFKKNGKQFIRLTEKGIDLKLTLDLIISKYFKNGGVN